MSLHDQYSLPARTPLYLLVITTALATGTNIISLSHGITSIFQNLYYFPIIIASAFYLRRGFLFSLFLIGCYGTSMLLYSKDPDFYPGVLVRMLIFMLVAGTITYLSSLRSSVTETLKQSEERLKFVIEGTNDGVWDEDLEEGRLSLSPRGWEILGCPTRDASDCVNGWSQLLHPDDVAARRTAFDDYLQGRSPGFVVEERLKTCSGEWKWILTRGKGVSFDTSGGPTKMVGTITDLSRLKDVQDELARKNEDLNASLQEITATEEELRFQYDTLIISEEKLRETTEFLENLISCANVPIIVWNRDHVIIRINNACLDLIGRKNEEIIGKSLEILFPPDQIPKYRRLMETTQAGVRWDTVELEIIHQNGSVRTVVWNSSTLYSQDGSTPVATIAQGRDITILKRLEKEQEISVKQIQKNLAQMAILNDGIRNPLMVILSIAEISNDTRLIDILESEVTRIDEMVTKLDQRWLESEKILSMLRKNYQINISGSTDGITFLQKTQRGRREDAERQAIRPEFLLEEVEAELYTILDSIDAMIYVVDLETYEFLYLNRMGRRVFGNYTGKLCYQLIQKDQGGPCPFCISHLLVDEHGPTGVHVAEHQNSLNGRWYDCRDRAVRWRDGRMVHIQIATDITDRKIMEESIRESEKKFRDMAESLQKKAKILSILNSIITRANQAEDLQAALRITLSGILALLEFDGGGVYIVNQREGTATVLHSISLPSEFLAEIKTIPVDKSPYDALFLEGNPIITDHYEQVAPERAAVYGFKSLASVPLVCRDRILGAINVISKKKAVLPDDVKQILVAIGRELGTIIGRIVSEEEAKSLKSNLESLFNAVHEIVFILDRNGSIIRVNDSAILRLRYTREELLGTDIRNLFDRADKKGADLCIKGILSGNTDTCTSFLLRKDGSGILAEMEISKVLWENRDVLILVSREKTRNDIDNHLHDTG